MPLNAKARRVAGLLLLTDLIVPDGTYLVCQVFFGAMWFGLWWMARYLGWVGVDRILAGGVWGAAGLRHGGGGFGVVCFKNGRRRLSCRTGSLRGRRSLRDLCWASLGPPVGRRGNSVCDHQEAQAKRYTPRSGACPALGCPSGRTVFESERLYERPSLRSRAALPEPVSRSRKAMAARARWYSELA
jgi:hypothetical protein